MRANSACSPEGRDGAQPTISGLGLARLTSSQLTIYLSNSPLVKMPGLLLGSHCARRPLVLSIAPLDTA